MKTIKLEGTEATPFITLDFENGIYEFSGRSLPEDSSEFFKPILAWFDDLKGTKSKCDFIFKLEYFNTASSKIILDILLIMETIAKEGAIAKVIWYHHSDDEDMIESGKEFQELVEGITFEFRIY